MASVPLSVLDLSPIIQGGDASLALKNSLDLARHAEQLGYRRYWVAEHHNMPGIASAATSVVIGHIAGGTSTIRVGAGGIMLPNHAPLVIAEQFGTLAALFPGRIDLGVGRAPGTDPRTALALRRTLQRRCREFSPGCAGADRLSGRSPARPGGARHSRHGQQGAGVDSGIEPLWRATGGGAGPALRLCLAFRAGAAGTERWRFIARDSVPRASWTSRM